MNQDPIDLYTTLGVDRNATLNEIETAYSSWQARINAGEPLAMQASERIRYAYEVLSTPHRRGTYDSLIAETAGSSVKLDVALSAESLPLQETPQVVYVLLALRSREASSKPRRPLNIGLVVDRSTSMRGERLKKVIAALELLLDKLGPDDILSLVSFSDRATVVLPAAALGTAAQSADPQTALAWHDPRRRLTEITASGGTEIYQGLRAGLDQVALAAGEDRHSHLILLTDGHTYGDAEQCLLLAQAAARGIGMTAFGLGADWNDSFLDALVAPSSGQSHFIERPDDVFASLEGRLDGLGALYARNLCLRRSWPGQFVLRNAYKLTPFLQPLARDSNPLALGALEGRAPLTVLLEFQVAPQANSTRFRIPLEVTYTLDDGSESSVGVTTQLLVPDRARYEAKDPPTRVIEAVWRVNLYQLQERAWQEAQMGQTDTAAALMRRLSSRYLETGELRLADQAQQEAQRLAQRGAISAEGRKLLKYGTRSLARDNKP